MSIRGWHQIGGYGEEMETSLSTRDAGAVPSEIGAARGSLHSPVSNIRVEVKK